MVFCHRIEKELSHYLKHLEYEDGFSACAHPNTVVVSHILHCLWGTTIRLATPGDITRTLRRVRTFTQVIECKGKCGQQRPLVLQRWKTLIMKTTGQTLILAQSRFSNNKTDRTARVLGFSCPTLHACNWQWPFSGEPEGSGPEAPLFPRDFSIVSSKRPHTFKLSSFISFPIFIKFCS